MFIFSIDRLKQMAASSPVEEAVRLTFCASFLPRFLPAEARTFCTSSNVSGSDPLYLTAFSI